MRKGLTDRPRAREDTERREEEGKRGGKGRGKGAVGGCAEGGGVEGRKKRARRVSGI